MISAYIIVLLVWAMVLTNLWVIHHFWLGVFEEDQAEQEVNERHQQGPNGPLMASDRELPTPVPESHQETLSQLANSRISQRNSKGLAAAHLVEEFTPQEISAKTLSMKAEQDLLTERRKG
jgi:hypothetical protein